MTVSATAPVCYQLISPKSPEYASPAMKLCQPLREPVESRHSDGPGCAAANSHRTQPAGPSALQSQRETHLPAFEFQPPASGTSHGIACYLPIRVDLLWIAMTTNGGTYTKEIKRMTPAPQMMSKKAAPIQTRSVAANCTRRLARGRRYRGLDFHSGI